MTSAMSESFVDMSARLGSDPMLVQGAGGNTSLKSDGFMKVKASGLRLSDAGEHDIFVTLDLERCVSLMANGEFGFSSAIVTDEDRPGLRPSIETALHVMMPQKVVAHVHALNSIAASIQPALKERMNACLEGLAWARVAYKRPGEPLALAVERTIAQAPVEVLILENHGLIVGADDCEEAKALIGDVERRLEPLMRDPAHRVADARPEGSIEAEFFPVSESSVHAIAFDEIAYRAAGVGALYPDHVVFLGPGVVIAADNESLADAYARGAREAGAPIRTVIRPGRGVYCHGEPSRTDLDMLVCLAEVCARLKTPLVNVLTRAQALELVDWDAEKYRKDVARLKNYKNSME